MRLLKASGIILGVTAALSAGAGTVLIDFENGVGPLDFVSSGPGTLTASGGRAVFDGANVTLLADLGVPQTSSGTVSCTMTIHPTLDAPTATGLIIVDASDANTFATALVSSNGLVTLVDYIGNFRNVQFFAPNAGNNVLILEYNGFTERATLTINPGTPDEDSAFLEIALDGANNVIVGVATNGPGGFEEFGATASGFLDFPTAQPQTPTVDGVFGQGFTTAGSNLTIGANISGTTPPVTYQWMFNAAPVIDDPPRVTGSNDVNLLIQDVTAADSGVYQLEFSDAAKAGPFLSPPIQVQIVAPGSLPAASPWALSATVLLLIILGARFSRRLDPR